MQCFLFFQISGHNVNAANSHVKRHPSWSFSVSDKEGKVEVEVLVSV